VVIQLKESFLLVIVGIYLIIGPNFGTVFAAHKISDQTPPTNKISDQTPPTNKISDQTPPTNKISDQTPPTNKISEVTSIEQSTTTPTNTTIPPPVSITVDLNKVRFGIGESVHIFGKAYSNATIPWTGKVIVEVLDSNNSVVFKTSSFPLNGTYRADIQNTLQPGKYTVNVRLDNTNEGSWTSFQTVNYWGTWSFYSIIGGLICIALLAAINAVGIRNIRITEVTNFLLFSGILLSILLTVFFADVDLGPNSPIGLVLQTHGQVGSGDTSQGSTQWIINVGGNQRNNYEDGLAIPLYVVVFGVIGGYLRILYEAATSRRSQTSTEFKKIENEVERMPDSLFEFREPSLLKHLSNWVGKRFTKNINHEIKAVKINPSLRRELGLDEKTEYDDDTIKTAIIQRQILISLRHDEMYRGKHRLFLYRTMTDLALLFLAPIFSIVAWFLLAQAGIQGEATGANGQTGIFFLAAISFIVGFVTNEIIQTLTRFSNGILQGMSRQRIPAAETKSIAIYISEKPTNTPVGTETMIKARVINKKTGEIVSGAKITGLVMNPSNVAYVRLPQKLSNLDGDVEYSLNIFKDTSLGTYLVSLNAEAEGYESGLAQFNFTVVEPEQLELARATRTKSNLKTGRSPTNLKQAQTLPSLDLASGHNNRSSVGLKQIQTLPTLDATITISNNMISAGMKQTLEVSVVGFHSAPPDVTVNGEIIYPSGLGVVLQETRTDDNGLVSYNWFIDNNAGTGSCMVKIYLSKDGYFDKELETQYEII